MGRARRPICWLVLLVLLAGGACRSGRPTAMPTSPPSTPSPYLTVPSPLPSPSPSPSPPPLSPLPSPTSSLLSSSFTFAVAADMRNYAGPGPFDSPRYFRGVCETIAEQGDVAFMVSPGDLDPPQDAWWTIQQTLGPDFRWYPVVGNHDTESGDDLAWLRTYDYGPVNPGPSGCPTTTYSFDYRNAHFVVLNVYCDADGDAVTDGDVPDHLYEWLAADLEATDQTHVFVFGHEPAYPQPDADSGRTRHVGDSLDAHPEHRDRFWNLLADRGVVAYICGHTHNYSAIRIDGVWQLDAGHARGMGDSGARSTFLLIRVEGDAVVLETYRDDGAGGPYTLVERVPLAGGAALHLPLVTRLALVSDG